MMMVAFHKLSYRVHIEHVARIYIICTKYIPQLVARQLGRVLLIVCKFVFCVRPSDEITYQA